MRSFLFLFALLAASALASDIPPLVQEFMRINATSWNSGGVCNDAVTASVSHFNRGYWGAGVGYRVPIFSTTDPTTNHTLFVLEAHGCFWVIDSVVSGDRYFPVAARLKTYSPAQQVTLFRKLCRRPLVSFAREATDMDLDYWANEEEWIAERKDKIERALSLLGKMRKVVELGEKVLGNNPVALERYKQRVLYYLAHPEEIPRHGN